MVTAVGGRSVGSGILHALTRSTQEVSMLDVECRYFCMGFVKVEKDVIAPIFIQDDKI